MRVRRLVWAAWLVCVAGMIGVEGAPVRAALPAGAALSQNNNGQQGNRPSAQNGQRPGQGGQQGNQRPGQSGKQPNRQPQANKPPQNRPQPNRPAPRPPQQRPPARPVSRPNYSFGDGGNGFRLRQYYSNDMSRINRNRRPHFYAGHYFPRQYVTMIQPIPGNIITYLPPVPPGYAIGYYDGYAVVYNPATLLIASVLDLFRY